MTEHSDGFEVERQGERPIEDRICVGLMKLGGVLFMWALGIIILLALAHAFGARL